MNSMKLLHISKFCFLFIILPGICGVCKAQDSPKNQTATNEVPATGTYDELGNFFSDVWLEGTDMVRILWKECSKKVFEKESTTSQDILPAALKCVKRKTLKAMDRTLSADVIPLAQGVELVRYQQINKNGKLIKPHGYNPYNGNGTGRLENGDSYENSDWKYAVLEKSMKVFKTHVLKIDVEQEEKMEAVEPRHRRRNQMMQMMMFGILSMGMILVPMGFQFLAVLGGKALLLAKFALILSSIQALKKASAGPVNYAFPIAPVAPEHTFEKRGYDTPVTDTEIKAEIEEAQQYQVQQYQGLESDNSGKIAYRFDHDTKVWKPQQSSLIKRSDTVMNTQNSMQRVYPVYSVSPSSSPMNTNLNNNVNQNNGNEIRPVYSGFQPMIDSMISENYKVQPTEIHAEYTIDLPIDKVQLKTTSPFITTNTQ